MLQFNLMSDQTDNYINLLKPFGLNHEEADIYLYLLKNGSTTALKASRDLHISRTKVYRLLDKLQIKQLVQFKVDDRGMKFGATDPEKFSQIVIEKEQETEKLKKNLELLLPQLEGLNQQSVKDSKIIYYKGIEGLKQVSWNALKAKGLLRVFEVDHISDFLPVEFAEQFREELVRRKITTYDLSNKKSLEAYTKVTDLIKEYSQSRYINPEKLEIKFETLIYNDVYAIYSYKDGEIFCAEIYDQSLADMQKQLFDFIWDQSQSLEYIDNFGKARLAK